MLQSVGSQRVGHNWATEQQQLYMASIPIYPKSKLPESTNKMCLIVIDFHIDNSRELKDPEGSSTLLKKHSFRILELKEIWSENVQNAHLTAMY